MTNKYVNISNAWDGNGGTHDGSSQINAYTYAEMITAINNGSTNIDYKLEGHRTGAAEFNLTNNLNTQINNTIDALDIEQPWVLELTSGVGVRIATFGTNGNILSNLKNGIIKITSNNFAYGNGSPGFGALTTNILMQNMFIISPQDGGMAGALNAEIDGCTFVSPAFQFYKCTNAIVKNSVITGEIAGFDSTNVTVTGLVTSKANESAAHSGTGTFTFTSGTCQYGWTPAGTFPPTDLTNGALFLEQVIAPDSSANDITVLATAPFTGYVKGLFGGQDRTTSRGIGAFKFEPLLIFRSKPASVIPSSKKFLYLPVVDGGTMDSFTITTMPTGMTLNGTTGRIEWTPLSGVTTSGALTLTAHSGANTVDQAFTLTVGTAPRIVSSAPDVATNGSLFNYQPIVVDAENNVSGSAYTLVNPPAGMTISATTGLVSWTPSSTGTFTFTVKVTDTNGLFDAQMVRLVVS